MHDLCRILLLISRNFATLYCLLSIYKRPYIDHIGPFNFTFVLTVSASQRRFSLIRISSICSFPISPCSGCYYKISNLKHLRSYPSSILVCLDLGYLLRVWLRGDFEVWDKSSWRATLVLLCQLPLGLLLALRGVCCGATSFRSELI